MTILIDPRSGRPIYDQIVSQLRKQILTGELPADAPLPSIRSLAKDLGISVITTKRAYEELEGAGLIYTQPGRGSFVAGGGHDALREKRLEPKKLELRMQAKRVKLILLEAKKLAKPGMDIFVSAGAE